MPVKAALPLPGAVAAFSMSSPMMKLVACHSPGGMDTPSSDECMPSSFESWYQASLDGGHGQVREEQRAGLQLEAPLLAARRGCRRWQPP
jgi:hypothetical protein